MWSSDLLYYMLPEQFRIINQFINSNLIPEFKNFVTMILSNVLEKHNINISEIWYKYTKDAVQFIKPIAYNYNDFFDDIEENKNFYMLSGDYTKNPGWVNSCLYIVEKKYNDIIEC